MRKYPTIGTIQSTLARLNDIGTCTTVTCSITERDIWDVAINKPSNPTTGVRKNAIATAIEVIYWYFITPSQPSPCED
jgi:hypothetical protein